GRHLRTPLSLSSSSLLYTSHTTQKLEKRNRGNDQLLLPLHCESCYFLFFLPTTTSKKKTLLPLVFFSTERHRQPIKFPSPFLLELVSFLPSFFVFLLKTCTNRSQRKLQNSHTKHPTTAANFSSKKTLGDNKGRSESSSTYK
ncbi:unnamed protein product, partial [Linum tenue]